MEHRMVKQGKGRKCWYRCSCEDCWWVWLGTYASERPRVRKALATAEWDARHAATAEASGCAA